MENVIGVDEKMAGKNNKNLGIIIVFAFIAIMFIVSKNGTFLGAAVGQGGTSEIERELSTSTAFAGDQVEVSYHITVGPDTECGAGEESTCNDFYVIDDQIPQEVTVLDISSPICELVSGSPQRMVCMKLQDATSTTLSYTIQMPATQQQVIFSGTYMIQGDESVNSLHGDGIIDVQEEGGCMPDWECTAYGDWTIPSKVCGTRTRICSDLNNCGTNVGKPQEIDTSACPDSVCDNNQAEVGEVCDGTDLNGLNCAALGDFSGGILACLPNCGGYDTASCIPTTSGSGGDKGSCVSNWECEEWTSCIDGKQTRTCRDKELCYNPTNTPDQEIPCSSGAKSFDPKLIYGILIAVVLYLMSQSGGKKKKSSIKRRRN